jgi:hypothetical protein
MYGFNLGAPRHAQQRKVTVMSTKSGRWMLKIGVLGSILVGAAPVWAQGSHGGGGHASGGHAGGGAHAAAAGRSAGAPHYAAASHVSSAAGRGYAGAGYAHGYPAGPRGGAYAAHGAYGHAGGYYGHGYSTGAFWNGGYWHGGFWPRAYYGLGFSWFLPVLPLAYATYWYGGIPYYYANDVYYTYNPGYQGYVATDPPPATDPNAVAPQGAPPGPDMAPGAAPGAAPAPSGGGPVPGQIFMYPRNGQSAEQQATDKAECQQWAAQQAGQVAQNGSDYDRAMAACVEGRGYSAR